MEVTKEILTLAVATVDASLRTCAEVYIVEVTVIHIF